MADIFLSYDSEDRDRVKPLVDLLESHGFSVWWDTRMSAGSVFDREIEEQLNNAACVIVVWSARSVESNWVREEAQEGLDRNILVPVQIDECRIPLGFRRTQAEHLIGWPGGNTEPTGLLNAVSAAVGRESAGEPMPAAADANVARGKWLRAGGLVAALAVLVAAALWYWHSSGQTEDESWITGTALPQMRTAIDHEQFVRAYLLARDIERRVPAHPALPAIWPEISIIAGDITSYPPGAEIAYRQYDDPGAAWQTIGMAPVAGARVPRGMLRWRAIRAGYQPLELIGFSSESPRGVVLLPADASRAVYVPSYELNRDGSGQVFNDAVQLPGFVIGKYEVTNAEYQQFVDAGGYTDASYWQGLEFFFDGKPSPRAEAMARLVDSTGRPGPATWELGSYPRGRGEYPVAGVSWYEAMAYARFRGQELPTIYHWVVAAIPYYAPYVSPLSNFSGDLMKVGQLPNVGPFGAADMAGNVREWTLNEYTPGQRWIMGGGFNEPEYVFSGKYAVPEDDRSQINGIRLARFDEPFDATYRQPFREVSRDNRLLAPVSDEVYSVLSEQFVDRGGPLNPQSEGVTEHADYTLERVRLDSDVAGERLILNVYRPVAASKPYQTVVVFPSWLSLNATPSTVEDNVVSFVFQLAMNTKRALVWPVYWGTHERFDDARYIFSRANLESGLLADAIVHWHSDTKRTLDYLSSSTDFDSNAFAYVGVSLGAAWPVPLLAIEHRFKAAVLWSGGLPYRGWVKFPALADPINYVSRITLPVLMLNGEYDTTFPTVTSQEPMWTLLGSPAADKRRVVFPGTGHGLPRKDSMREMGDWLDHYLGVPGQPRAKSE